MRQRFPGVEPDNLDSWTRLRGTLTAKQNLAIAQKNTAQLADAGRRLGFDFAIAEECQAYQEYGSYLNAYGARVIEIEFPVAGGTRNFPRACHPRGKRIAIVYRDRNVAPAGRPGFVKRRCPTSSAAR